MNAIEELIQEPFHMIKIIDFRRHFEEVPFNGNQINAEERKRTIDIIDETVDQFSLGLPLLEENSKLYGNRQDHVCPVKVPDGLYKV